MPLKIFIVLLISILQCHQSSGQPNSNARIFRGTDATKNKFPWYIHITVKFPNIKGKDFYGEGGGVLISMKHILTVAHLFFPIGDIINLQFQMPSDTRIADAFWHSYNIFTLIYLDIRRVSECIWDCRLISPLKVTSPNKYLIMEWQLLVC